METGREWSRVALAVALLKSLGSEYRKLVEDADSTRADIVRRFQQRSSMVRGRHVHVDDGNGYEGVTEGLDDRGFLLVRTAAGLRTVLSGVVRSVNGK
jgi:BirA family biotin operon repressor/biotin-[acetyl-CoA-carboxylase] ligase